MPKPGELPFGIMPSVAAADLSGLFQRDFALQMRHQRRYAMGLHRRQQGIEFSRSERGDLVQRASFQHGIEPGINPRVERIAIGREKQRATSARRYSRRQSVAMPVGQRAAGRLDYFDRAGDAGAVARLQ